ncbi:S-layer homology domain-containing protein [Paenibacillus hexagrammi]|uniref:S-layer homology domain-containing protein n=1 Tax=Paenibacillus hexagrammi TaxID=2908839 RepID=A0ABY3SPZ2_9BACL|nr:S-layer homology domain-containing protein [Paenibacillus sp. YPD9-1]UJF35460.1 S-layer homology domain-containing protein [Paenibacillus sp. YPD9-1]
MISGLGRYIGTWNRRMGKQAACGFLSCALLLSAAGLVSAEEPAVHTHEAEMLNNLHLLQGTDQGFELEMTFTRAQGATMLLRLFGLEAAAVSSAEQPAVFSDMPTDHWAYKHVTYAYDQGYVHGVTDSTFAPESNMSGSQFIALTLRALGYKEAEPSQAGELAVTSGLLTAEEAKPLTSTATFLRDDMVEVAYRAIQTKLKDSQQTLLQKLVEDDQVISVADAKESGLYQVSAASSDDPMDQIEQALENALGN